MKNNAFLKEMFKEKTKQNQTLLALFPQASADSQGQPVLRNKCFSDLS